MARSNKSNKKGSTSVLNVLLLIVVAIFIFAAGIYVGGSSSGSVTMAPHPENVPFVQNREETHTGLDTMYKLVENVGKNLPLMEGDGSDSGSSIKDLKDRMFQNSGKADSLQQQLLDTLRSRKDSASNEASNNIPPVLDTNSNSNKEGGSSFLRSNNNVQTATSLASLNQAFQFPSTSILQNFFGDAFKTSWSTFVDAPSPLDSSTSTVLVSVWVQLPEDEGEGMPDIRTILSNKNTGCEATADRYGYSLYMNSWQTKDHKIYLEYGNQMSGCEKLASSSQLTPGEWYHVAFVLSPSSAFLFVNGYLEGTKSDHAYQPHIAQASIPLRLGKQPDSADSPYPFSGYLSHLVVAHVNEQEAIAKENDPSLSPQTFWEATVKQLLVLTSSANPPTVFTTKGLPKGIQAYYPLNDAPDKDAEFSENSPSPHARDLSPNQNHGDYHIAAMTSLSLSDISGIGEFATGLGEHTHGALSESEMASRADAVRNAMKHAWGSYEKHAFGRDELKPISGRGHDNWGGLGVTLVDSLDTLWLMGMKDEFWRAKDWVKDHLSFDHTGTVSFFETTIRELGGLLSAYDLSGDKVFLDKAQDLGNRLAAAFNSPTGLPKGQVNLQASSAAGGWTGSNSVLAELGTVQLEFNYLSAKTGDAKFKGYANRVYDVLEKINPSNGLFPIYINANNGKPGSHMITFGALGDSFYEYLLKVWVQTGRKDARLRKMYDNAMDGMVNVLLKKSNPSNLLYVSDFDGSRNINKMDHLVCFLPGTLALGAWLSDDPQGPRAQRDMAVAKGLMYTCYQMYARQATGISPEYVNFGGQSDFTAGPSANFYILRPETAESLYILHSITGNSIYAEWSFQIFSSIEKYCKTSLAYGSLSNVNDASERRRIDDRMESFFLGETLKYLYLAQAPPNTVNLQKQVFNTEAHPLSVIE